MHQRVGTETFLLPERLQLPERLLHTSSGRTRSDGDGLLEQTRLPRSSSLLLLLLHPGFSAIYLLACELSPSLELVLHSSWFRG